MPKLILDIAPPKRSRRHAGFFFKKKNVSSRDQEPGPKIIARGAEPSPRRFRAVIFAGVLITLAAGGFSVFGAINLKRQALDTAPFLIEKFKEAARALVHLETTKAESSLTVIDESIANLTKTANTYGILSLSEFFGNVVPRLKAIPETLKDINALTKISLETTATIETLAKQTPRWLTRQEGTLFTASLERIRDNIRRITELNTSIKNRSNSFGDFSGENFLTLSSELYKTERFLASSAEWMKRSGTKHLLMLFQNPSELRPGGGFIGSYADLVLTKDGLQDIKVWDIYDPDGQLDKKIVPPKQLQGLTTSWGARDANWFFDFPTSARKVIDLLEHSKIYAEESIAFDGAIAINVNIIKTLLDVTGPIELPEYDLTITSKNFLSEIQREIETKGQAKSGEPKRILKVLAPKLFESITALGDEGKQAFWKAIKTHTDRKDIMVYFKNLEMQTYIDHIGLSGGVAETPSGFRGEYLAVVHANIGGGKADAVTTQKVKLHSTIHDEKKNTALRRILVKDLSIGF